VMSALERSAIGPFRMEQSVGVDELTPETLLQHLQPALAALVDLPRIELTEAQMREIRHGRPIPMPPGIVSSSEWAAVNSAGELVAILSEKHPGQLWPEKNFANP